MPAARNRLDPQLLFHPLAGASHVALAVSGGSDSMALLRLMADWPARPPTTVLTVDHGLRPAATREAEQVARWAAAAGLPHVALRWAGEKPVTGLQARARAARYDLMSAWCEAHRVSWLLTAHTEDDQAETVLMRMARTASLESLAGIPRLGHWKGVRLFRPLLGLGREALRELLQGMGQAWIDDPSNDDRRFERVRIRKALPALAEINVTAAKLAELAAEIRRVLDGLDQEVADWVARHVTILPEAYARVELALLSDLNGVVRRRLLGWLVRRFGSGDTPEPGELDRLSHWLASPGTRRTLGGALLARRRNHLLVGREPGRINPAALVMPEAGRLAWDGRFAVSGPAGAEVLPALAVPGLERAEALPAFVQQSLPAVRFGDGRICIPHLGLGEGATASLLSARPG